jgi:hypothetical protein
MDAKLLEGRKCRAERSIISHQGTVKAKTEGIIQHVIKNLDRQLINVEWENGVTSYAFPDEVQIQQSEGTFVPLCKGQERKEQ